MKLISVVQVCKYLVFTKSLVASDYEWLTIAILN